MKILVTGARGFVGKNLVCELRNRGEKDIVEFDVDTPMETLKDAAKDCGFVFHLAGVNRPQNEQEFMEGNFGFTSTLLDTLETAGNKAPVLITSSIQAALDNPYGRSKKAGEDLLFAYGLRTGAPVFVYRMPNVFGKWCRPNYNSAVATFCHNIARDLPVQVKDPAIELSLVYIDDVVAEFLRALAGTALRAGDYCAVEPVHKATLGRIVGLLQGFRASRTTLQVPQLNDAFESKLYSTYLAALPEDQFSYPLKMNVDARGSFTEFLRTPDRGQVSVNVSKPGITKGNHWHHSKNEKFLVVKGQGVIRFRKVGETKVIEYPVSGEKLEVVDIPTGYTHNIENTGEGDLVTVMWANEAFNPEKPDTYFEKV